MPITWKEDEKQPCLMEELKLMELSSRQTQGSAMSEQVSKPQFSHL